MDVHELYHKCLGFHWFRDGSERFHQFTVLPFGLSPCSYVFLKIMRPLTKKWRGQGLKAVIFLDDGIVSNGDERSTKMAAETIRRDLLDAGFLINHAKSDFLPTQKREWMGVIIDTTKLTFEFPGEKLPNSRVA